MVFWGIVTAIALIVAAVLARALLRGGAAGADTAAHDIGVYRDQLAEVDRDLARGVIGAPEAERLRTEISRRILAADDAGHAQGRIAPRAASRAMALAVVAALLGGGLWLYRSMGAPGYGDLSLQTRIEAAAERRATRPDQQEIEAQMPPHAPSGQTPERYLQLMEQLRRSVAERPDELQGHILLARNEARLGNYKAAYAAQERVIALRGDAARPQDYADLAELLILAAGGYVSPQAEAALRETLARDPRNGVARFYTGLMMAQTGRPDVAFRHWRALLNEGPEDAPWIAPIRARIMDLAQRAGVNYTLPDAPGVPDAPGPSQADIEAAGEMTGADRAEMIRGMVARLSDRLATEGGPPEDWARLIGAYGVLNETGRARAIWEEARQVFAGNDAALAALRAGAARAGLVE